MGAPVDGKLYNRNMPIIKQIHRWTVLRGGGGGEKKNSFRMSLPPVLCCSVQFCSYFSSE